MLTGGKRARKSEIRGGSAISFAVRNGVGTTSRQAAELGGFLHCRRAIGIQRIEVALSFVRRRVGAGGAKVQGRAGRIVSHQIVADDCHSIFNRQFLRPQQIGILVVTPESVPVYPNWADIEERSDWHLAEPHGSRRFLR